MTKINLIIILFFSSLTLLGQDSLPKKTGWTISNRNKVILRSDNPIIVLNENLVDYELLNNLDSDKIKSMNVIKGDSSIGKYGEIGKYGTIEITSKGISKKELSKLYKLYAYSYEPNTKEKSKIITGKITDCENVPLKAAIQNLNSNVITQSDSLGNYTIEVHKDDVLISLDLVQFRNEF